MSFSSEYLLVNAGVLLLVFILTMAIRISILKMIENAGYVRYNYSNKLIPVSFGIIFPVSLLGAYIPLSVIFPYMKQTKPLVFLLLVIFSSFLGLIDDFLGSRETSGLKGHLKKLFKGELTTGGFKAVFGGLFSVLVAIVSGPLALVPLNALIIALFTNFLNLLDLRPGRAAKMFIFISLLVIVAGWGQRELTLVIMLLGSVLAVLPLDLKALVMMGDAGSNALGAGLGVVCVWMFEPGVKIVILLLLVVFHLIAEKYSLTQVIAGNRFLKFLDTLGRDK